MVSVMDDFEWIGPGVQLPERLKHGVVAIGNFDGVHRGHRAVLDEALRIAGEIGAPALVLTFEPHPRTFFRPQSPVFRLTPPAQKARLMRQLGFAAMIEKRFDEQFSGMPASSLSTACWARNCVHGTLWPERISTSARTGSARRSS